MKTRAYVGLGSNLDAPAEQLRSALQALDQVEQTRLVAASALYTSDSLLPGQPRYTNAVAALDTALIWASGVASDPPTPGSCQLH